MSKTEGRSGTTSCRRRRIYWQWVTFNMSATTTATKWRPRCCTTSRLRNWPVRSLAAGGKTSRGVGVMPDGHTNSLHSRRPHHIACRQHLLKQHWPRLPLHIKMQCRPAKAWLKLYTLRPQTAGLAHCLEPRGTMAPLPVGAGRPMQSRTHCSLYAPRAPVGTPCWTSAGVSLLAPVAPALLRCAAQAPRAGSPPVIAAVCRPGQIVS
jgi:hypothetical protein